MKNKSENNVDLLYELVKTNFILKYNGSILGFIWILLKPFLQFTILYIVFSQFGGNSEIKNFSIYLLTGLILFSFFQEGILTGVQALLGKAHIILKVNFDRTLAIYSTLILALINLFINFVIVLIFVMFNPVDITFTSLFYSLFVILLSIILVTSIAFFTSIITVRIRDLQHIVEVAMQFLFYATAVFYQIDIIPEPYRNILQYNPLYIIIDSIRNAFIYGEITHERKIFGLFIISIFTYFIGFLFFKSKVKKIAEYF